MIRPLGNKVLIEVLSAEKMTAGGLHIPASAQEKSQRGKVIAVGPEIDSRDVKVGDTVVFGRYAGTEVKSSRVELTDGILMMTVDDLLGVVEE